MYRVVDAMTVDPLCVAPDDSLATASELMHNARVRHLPVVIGGVLVGLLTQRDLMRVLGGSAGARGEVMQARDFMVTSVVTTGTELPLRKAAQVLFNHRFGCLPVIDSRRRVVGILTETDFIRFAANTMLETDRADAVALRAAS